MNEYSVEIVDEIHTFDWKRYVTKRLGNEKTTSWITVHEGKLNNA
jgi:hypothetical protein